LKSTSRNYRCSGLQDWDRHSNRIPGSAPTAGYLGHLTLEGVVANEADKFGGGSTREDSVRNVFSVTDHLQVENQNTGQEAGALFHPAALRVATGGDAMDFRKSESRLTGPGRIA
jgi:hypothetical protein